MSLFESGDSTGDVSLKELCNNNLKQKLTGEVDLKHLAGLIIRGGWPGNLEYSPSICYSNYSIKTVKMIKNSEERSY